MPMTRVPNNVKFGVPLLLVSFAVFAILLALGDTFIRGDQATASEATTDGGGGGGGGGGSASLTIVAKNLAFDKRSLTAPAGGQITVTLDNQDAGVQHNISFYKSKSQTSAPLTQGARGNLITGPAKEDIKFAAPPPGNYYFQCDVHPDMNGSFVVK
jgi:plastocyanin